MSTGIVIPPAQQLRQDIRDRADELRALRKLLRLAEAAECAGLPVSAIVHGNGDQRREGRQDD